MTEHEDDRIELPTTSHEDVGGDVDVVHTRDDRDLWEGVHEGPRAFKLLQGYIWHPRESDLDLAALLPRALDKEVHLLVDALPQAPFTFFDDGTMSATQQVYQLTIVAIVQPDQDPARMLPAAAALLQTELDKTPPGVGWELMEDLREIGS
ncbi:MAG TPA: DUF3208 family protein [Trueperaceae bacterium]|nr:DUF3208 family protein [Trueperaceae bacterium]